ncbi:MAG: hypothetical protein QN172_03355 [Armatimonadota bacterium]|nr:hypothetical protein [Armatimonadota bacterium]MDR7438856.1 hypothetical protein [Armatimonadota bacterium]MDR7601477.1 hypothetical protein [Armatimonadota bacterium]
MPVVNCPRCGRLAALLLRGQCPACIEEEHAQLRRLRAYLNAHGPLPAEEIAQQTGIPLDRVLRWLREGRLMVAEAEVRCRRCGRRIPFGLLCAGCRAEFLTALRELRQALERLRQTAPPPRRRRIRGERVPERFDLW